MARQTRHIFAKPQDHPAKRGAARGKTQKVADRYQAASPWGGSTGYRLVEVGVVHVGVRSKRGMRDRDSSGFESAAHLVVVGAVDT